ncbi:MAG: hypothetical protein K8R74_08615 [Bacteroidales bacterium]|nr:hypothetical protein [Bacteroidales bacterium]
MKSITILLSVILFVLTIGINAQKPYEHDTQVNFLQKESQGTITVRSVGKAKKLNDAIVKAEQNVFDVLLFRGIPETDVSTPMITDEGEAKANNQDFFNQFFDGYGYKKFIMSSIESSPPSKKKGVRTVTLDIKVNIQSLRKELENSGIIRKFGC